MFGFSLRRAAWVALVLAGCGGVEIPVAVHESALSSCNVGTDCPTPTLLGRCVEVVCNADHTCGYANKACAGDCMPFTGDCSLGAGACYLPACTGGTCVLGTITMPNTCACTKDADCPAPSNSACQNAGLCTFGSCTYTAKQPLAQPCCNVTDDCGGAATCVDNTCDCGSGNKFCSGSAPRGGHCVATSGCCAPTECPTGNACQVRTCSAAGACGFDAASGPLCCNPANGNGDCGGTAICTDDTCTCGAGEKFCPGATRGSGKCIAMSACCKASDCPAHPDASAACDNSNVCVYTCDNGFHDCNGTCKSSSSVMSCGTSCTACPSGNACQTPACTAGACGFVATSTAGCCNVPADCPTPAEPCLQRICVANQCGTAPIPGCTEDAGTPADLATEPQPDLAVAPDLAGAISVTGGGGCALGGGRAPAPPTTPLMLLAFAVLALRRRSRT